MTANPLRRGSGMAADFSARVVLDTKAMIAPTSFRLSTRTGKLKVRQGERGGFGSIGGNRPTDPLPR